MRVKFMLGAMGFFILIAIAGHAQTGIDFSPAPIVSKPKYVICEPANRNYSGAKRVALVIGNTDYNGEFRRLENAVNDAKSVSTELLNSGFEVCYVNNLNLGPFNEVVGWFARRIEQGAEVLVFFSGHGIEPAGVTFLMPLDASEHKDSTSLPTGIDLQEFSKAIRSRAPQMALYIIDACRNNPYKDAIAAKSGTAKGSAPSTARLAPPMGTAMLFSAGPNEDSIDKLNSADKNLHSVFTRELLPLLREDGLSLRMLAETVTERVHQQSSGYQTPAPILNYVGEFYFHPQSEVVTKPNPPGPQNRPDGNTVSSLGATATPTVAIVKFVNKVNESVSVYWDPKNGALVKYSEIPVGGSYSVQTYAGHTWVIKGASGREYLAFTPDSSTKVASVEIVGN
jgi:hypothetical protein